MNFILIATSRKRGYCDKVRDDRTITKLGFRVYNYSPIPHGKTLAAGFAYLEQILNMKTIFFITCGLITSSLYGQVKLEPFRLGITVKSVEQASHWYEDNLGFETYKKMDFPDYDGLKIYFLRQGEFEIELIEKKTSFSIKRLRPDYDINKEPLEGFSKIAFRINDLEQTFEKLKRNGVKQIIGITHDNEFDADFFMIEDTDGNILQFIRPVKK